MASSLHHYHLFLLFLSSLLANTAAVAAAAPPPPIATRPTASNEFLTAHNQARAAVGVGPLAWNATLVARASVTARNQRDKKSCEFADLGASNYGANQQWASFPVGPAEVVRSWAEVKQYYNHTSNSCAAEHECGTYTQVVWRKSSELGCAQARCNKAGATLSICLYYPHGNVHGQSPY